MRDYLNNSDWPNNKRDGYDDITEVGTVPGVASNYTIELSQRIVKNGTLVVTCGGNVLTVIPYGIAPGADQAGVSYELPLVQVAAARAGQAISVLYTPGGGVMSSGIFASMALDGGKVEHHTITVQGSVAAGVVGVIYIPQRGQMSRTVKRVTVFSGDTLAVSGSTTIAVAGVSATMTSVQNEATATGAGAVDVSAGDARVEVSCSAAGGHGNLSIEIEVE